MKHAVSASCSNCYGRIVYMNRLPLQNFGVVLVGVLLILVLACGRQRTKLHLKFSELVCFDTLNVSTFIQHCIAVASYFRKHMLIRRMYLVTAFGWPQGIGGQREVSVSKFRKARVGVCTGQAAGGKTSPSFRKGRVAWAGPSVSVVQHHRKQKGRCGQRVRPYQDSYAMGVARKRQLALLIAS